MVRVRARVLSFTSGSLVTPRMIEPSVSAFHPGASLSAQALIHRSAWRDCLIIPEVPRFGVLGGVSTRPEVLFRRLSCHPKQPPKGAKAIYQTVSGREILRSSHSPGPMRQFSYVEYRRCVALRT